MPDLEDRESSVAAVEKIRAHLATPYFIGGAAIEVATSIGMAVYPLDGSAYEDLLRQSDVAMYRDKGRGPAKPTLGAMGLREADSFLKGEDTMNAGRILAIALIVAGGLGLAYGSFSYTNETHKATLGPIELSVKDKETVNVPAWAGVGAIVIGGLLFLFANKKG